MVRDSVTIAPENGLSLLHDALRAGVRRSFSRVALGALNAERVDESAGALALEIVTSADRAGVEFPALAAACLLVLGASVVEMDLGPEDRTGPNGAMTAEQRIEWFRRMLGQVISAFVRDQGADLQAGDRVM